MVNNVGATNSELLRAGQAAQAKAPAQKAFSVQSPRERDSVEFGKEAIIPTARAMEVVLNRAYEELRTAVGAAREELGIPEGAVIDTSPEATAGRIADFALGFFDKYAENNGLENNEEGRQQYADFIGAAINQGIAEARDILTSLSALNGEVDANIDQTASLVQERLDNFVANGLGE